MAAIGDLSYMNRYGKKPRNGPSRLGDLPTVNRYGQPYGTASSPPRAPSAPAPSPAATPAAGAAPQPNPKDASYLDTISRLTRDRDRELTAIDQQTGYDSTDLAEAIRRLTEQRPRDEQHTKQEANKRGVLLSGYLGQQLGDLATNYQRQQGDLQTAFDRRTAERALQKQRIGSSFEDQSAGALADAIARQLQRDAGSADAGTLAPTPKPAAPAGPQPQVIRGYRSPSGRVGDLHIYPGGRRVFVPK